MRRAQGIVALVTLAAALVLFNDAGRNNWLALPFAVIAGASLVAAVCGWPR